MLDMFQKNCFLRYRLPASSFQLRLETLPPHADAKSWCRNLRGSPVHQGRFRVGYHGIPRLIWLVVTGCHGWIMTFPYYWEWNVIIPTDDLSMIFQRGRLKPPTSDDYREANKLSTDPFWEFSSRLKSFCKPRV